MTVAPVLVGREMTDALSPPPITGTRQSTSELTSPSRMSSNHSSPAALPELLREKELRAQQRLERSAEERGRRMGEQRRREQDRRAAAEEKRRQHAEGEKERLEALVRRRAGDRDRRGDALDNRPKRWTWGGPPGGVEGNPKTPPSHAIGSAQSNELPAATSPSQSRNACDFLTAPPSDPPISKRLSNSSANLQSPDRASPSPQRANRKSVSDDTRGAARTPTTEKSPAPCGPDSAMRRLESPTTPTRSSSPRAQSKGLGTPKRVRSTKSRAQSPCSPGQYPPSPLRQRATTPVTDGNQDRGHAEGKGHGTLDRKIPKSTSRDLGAESPGTPTGRNVAGTTDAEEASRLLAERRRLARVQKEQEEKRRQEDERLKAEEELRRREEAQERQEAEARRAEEERERQEVERRNKEEEDRRMKERRLRDMQDQLDREREKAFLHAQREAERKRQDRERRHIQEEQERLLRKKRIEEIMKRTRKTEADSPSSAQGVPEVRGLAGGGYEEDAGADVTPVPAPPDSPLITLGPLETKSCGDELSDGVQSMDVSPVSRDELMSAPEFSQEVTEGLNSLSNVRTLEQLLDLTAQGRKQETGVDSHPFPKLKASSAAGLGDLNKNLLIQAYNAGSFPSPARDSSQILHSLSSSPGKLDVQ
ncbi:MAP7 domain-containing protein 2 isoform X2 [Osmerus eperlanus]|uniref:MAP7 domain-containing protein 2 isoform X2 n=1 Tax=Osmerus eperlanus TaxID=29151 RepID=UPI002E14861C